MKLMRLTTQGKNLIFTLLFLFSGFNFIFAQGAGHSVYFDRNDNFVVVPDADILDGMAQLTVEAWVYFLGGDNTSWGIVVTKGIKYQLYRFENSNHIGVTMEGITNGNIDTGVDFDIDSWQHIAFTYDGSTLVVYKNGKAISTTTGLSGPVGFCDNDLLFGEWYVPDETASSPWFGYIDEVRIWRTARTQEQIKSTMNKKLTGNEDNLIGYWRFDENTGTTINDLTSYNNDGTIFGTQGKAESGGSRFIIDNDKSWSSNEWQNETIEITSGLGAGQSRTVGNNTATQINILGSDFNPDTGEGSYYRVTTDEEWYLSYAALGDKSHYGEGTSNLTETADVPVDITWIDDPGTDAIFAAIQNNQYPETTSGLLSYYPQTYWEIWIRRDDGSFQANVDFHFDNIGGINNENNLKLYSRERAGDSWTEVSNYTIYTEGDATDGVGYIRANGLTAFSQFIITSDNEPLPVELSSFSAQFIDNKIELNWRTTTEINNFGFEVQRSTANAQGQEWEKVGFVKGAGNSNSPKEYSFTDSVFTGGKYYYRLKQIDNDGFCSYSNTVEINVALPNKFTLFQNYPNPFNPSTVIRYSLQENEFVQLKIFDLLGREIATLVNKKQAPGNYSVQFNAENLPSGAYIYTLKAGNYFGTRKMSLVK